MADVIYSPGSNVGPGWSSNNGPGQSGTPTPIESNDSSGPADVIYAPGASAGGRSSYTDKLEREAEERIKNVNTNSSIDWADYIKQMTSLLDSYMEKYQKYNSDLYNDAKSWYENMSNTAIQRQVEDLKKAGINPILAGNLGGAPVSQMSAPYMSLSPSSALGSMASGLSSMYASDNALWSALQTTAMNNATSIGIQDMITLRDLQLAEMSNSNAIYIHNLDNSAKSTLETALQNNQFKHDFDMLDKELEKWKNQSDYGNTSSVPGAVQHYINQMENTSGVKAVDVAFDILAPKYPNIDLRSIRYHSGGTR